MNSLKRCKGKFITFEGIEGVGKSTQIKLFAEELRQADVEFVLTREPGGTEIAEEIRKVLLTHHKEEMTSVTELLLMFAARSQHIESVIKPALQAGKCVICDRFTDATYAYQGGGRGVALQNILQLENLVQGELRPDLTLLLDVPNVSLCLTRAKGLSDGDRIEREAISFFDRARKIYLSRAKDNSGIIKIINADNSISYIQQEILKIINEKFSVI